MYLTCSGIRRKEEEEEEEKEDEDEEEIMKPHTLRRQRRMKSHMISIKYKISVIPISALT